MAFVSLWCTTDLPCKFLKNRAHVVFGLSQNWMNFRTTIFGLDNSQYSGMTWPCLICIIARNQHRKCCLFPGGADLAVSVRKKKERKRKREKKRKNRTKWASPVFYYVAISPPPLSRCSLSLRPSQRWRGHPFPPHRGFISLSPLASRTSPSFVVLGRFILLYSSLCYFWRRDGNSSTTTLGAVDSLSESL